MSEEKKAAKKPARRLLPSNWETKDDMATLFNDYTMNDLEILRRVLPTLMDKLKEAQGRHQFPTDTIGTMLTSGDIEQAFRMRSIAPPPPPKRDLD